MKSLYRKPKTSRTVKAAQDLSIATAKVESGLKNLLLAHGKTIDAAHDNLSEAIEADGSDDDIRDAAVELCLTLNAFHEARKEALGDDATLPLPFAHVCESTKS